MLAKHPAASSVCRVARGGAVHSLPGICFSSCLQSDAYAGCNPYAVRSLREGRILSPDTLDRLMEFIATREARLIESAEAAAKTSSEAAE